MNKVRWMIGLMAMTVLLVLPASSFAQVDVEGSAVLHATGDGIATIHGMPADYINMSGDGVLYIVDRAGDASINVTGEGTRREIEVRGETVIMYRGFNGRAEVSGSDVLVRLIGENIVLDAAGQGRAMLRGTGTFQLQRRDGSHRDGNWASPGAEIELQ